MTRSLHVAYLHDQIVDGGEIPLGSARAEHLVRQAVEWSLER